MSEQIDPPKVIIETLNINNYRYSLGNLIPHKSVTYNIECFQDSILVKSFMGVLEGDEYQEWTTDDWLDDFIKQKIKKL